MFQHLRRTLLAGGLILTLVSTGITGLIHYDENVDRSRWEIQGERRYYYDFHGDRANGWQDIDGETYYFGIDGAMHTGWLEEEKERFHFGSDGRLQTGWLQTPQGRFYAGTDGVVHTGWLELDGSKYCFAEDGSLRTGLYEAEDGTYYFAADGRAQTGWVEASGQHLYFGTDFRTQEGWLEDGGQRYYLLGGRPQTGWLTLEDNLYYFGADGSLHTGWLEQGEYRYYFHSDGTMAVGPNEIDGRTYYFTPKGIEVILVNRDHYLPEDYIPELVTVSPYQQVDVKCYDALMTMLDDCLAAGYQPAINSTYRTEQQQWGILGARTAEYVESGMSYDEAYVNALLSVAYPGTSEHQLGLAVDIDGLGALYWLTDHCWEYGFILRYLDGKTDITGIIYEPWHFRYVGTEVSMDMKDSGLCLEEYLGAVS